MKTLLAFVHIEKAAGTTLIHILRRNYCGRYMDIRPMTRTREATFMANDLRLAMRINPLLACIAGHSLTPDSDLESVAPGIRYITLLRDPVDRYISQFRYWNRHLGKNETFAEFLEHQPAWNVQTRKFDNSGDVEGARRRLQEKFFQVGVVEQFDQFLALLRAALEPCSFDVRYQAQNTAGSDNRERDELLGQYGDEIRRVNADDIELYNFVREELIPADCARYGAGLAQDLMVAERANQELRPPRFRPYIDYALRKGYVEPITGLIRRAHGMPARGSYSDF